MKYKIILLIAILSFSVNRKESKAQISDIITIVDAAGEYLQRMQNMAETAQMAAQINELIEELICTKLKFDEYYSSASISYSNCLYSIEFKLYEIRFNAIYLDIAALVSESATSSDENDKSMIDVVNEVKNLTSDMKKMITIRQQQIIKTSHRRIQAKRYSKLASMSLSNVN